MNDVRKGLFYIITNLIYNNISIIIYFLNDNIVN
jgi:hypothetical protein